ncbi:LysM peptidoglycan-binding domain-containing protein [Paenibacillus chungangensis]|uniref:LysM peptidoglycan-binding domain-containing protein n=1 Tax=Paenibacillus chungangensis TaxID=696535 RepID=A0ABW3HQI8_9BACL
MSVYQSDTPHYGYGIQFSFNNNQEGPIELPVMPASIEISEGGKSSTYDVAGLGEVNVIKDRKLSEYSFSSFFPGQHQTYPFLSIAPGRILPPSEYVRYLTRWMDSKRPIRFIFVGKEFAINTPVSIESFQWKEAAGRGGDIAYSIKLKHYRFYAAKQYVIAGNEGGSVTGYSKSSRPDQREKPGTYTMQAGDTLWSIAQRLLGNGTRWRELQRLNGIADSDVRRLAIGKVLKLS